MYIALVCLYIWNPRIVVADNWLILERMACANLILLYNYFFSCLWVWQTFTREINNVFLCLHNLLEKPYSYKLQMNSNICLHVCITCSQWKSQVAARHRYRLISAYLAYIPVRQLVEISLYLSRDSYEGWKYRCLSHSWRVYIYIYSHALQTPLLPTSLVFNENLRSNPMIEH